MDSRKSPGKVTWWWVWGLFDAFYILWYVVQSVWHSRIPYWTDFTDTVWLLQDQGDVQLLLVALNWILQLSIIVSALLFLTQRSAAKWLGLAQIPLRLAFSTPSLSLLLLGVQLFPGYNPFLMLGLIVGSEIIKGWSLCTLRKTPPLEARA